MILNSEHEEHTRDLVEQIEIETSTGVPDKGWKQSVPEEQWMVSMAEATMREALRELLEEYVDQRGKDAVTTPMDLLSPDNIDVVYFSQYPWRPPFMAIELDVCPDWAQMTINKEAQVRTKKSMATETTVVYFQVREGL